MPYRTPPSVMAAYVPDCRVTSKYSVGDLLTDVNRPQNQIAGPNSAINGGRNMQGH